MPDRSEHWERIYRSKNAEEHTWYQASPDTSLALIALAGCDLTSRIIDVGGGTSRLTGALVTRGYRNLAVLDISSSALAESREQLGSSGDSVQWLVADITASSLEEGFDLWHDRAVFHFLTEAEDRAAYLRTLRRCLERGGHAIIATFAEDGPTQCSGLPVVRYGSDALAKVLGPEFELVETRDELHETPSGNQQSFVYCLFRRA